MRGCFLRSVTQVAIRTKWCGDFIHALITRSLSLWPFWQDIWAASHFPHPMKLLLIITGSIAVPIEAGREKKKEELLINTWLRRQRPDDQAAEQVSPRLVGPQQILG